MSLLSLLRLPTDPCDPELCMVAVFELPPLLVVVVVVVVVVPFAAAASARCLSCCRARVIAITRSAVNLDCDPPGREGGREGARRLAHVWV